MNESPSRKRSVNTDCRHFLGYKPCRPHKELGSICGACDHYDPLSDVVGIVKLGAMGDVLRTTALLPDIVAAHTSPRVVWFTLPESREILAGNEAISEIVTAFDASCLGVHFDCVYVLDNSPEAVRLGSVLHSKTKRGFRAGENGQCDGVYEGCDPTLFDLGLWDDLKRSNQEPYLNLLARAGGIEYSGSRPFVHIAQQNAAASREIVSGLTRPVVGINVDAGQRWLRKQWNLPYVEKAVQEFVRRGLSVVLIGGRGVEEWNETLAGSFDHSVRSAKTADSVGDLFALLSEIDVLLTGDTLAMHAAWAVGTPTVALFGPTSLPEITLAVDDVKLAATELSCLGCYLHTCSVSPHCMDRLKPELVVEGVMRRLRLAHAHA